MNRVEMRRRQKLAQKRAKNANSVQQTLNLAVEHHNAGRLPEAERLYRQILQADSRHPVALHLLGVIAHQSGKSDAAIDLITKALVVAPDYADAHYNLGNAFKHLGMLNEAAASYKKAISINPNYANAHNNLGLTLQDMNQKAEAITAYQKAVATNSNYAEAHFNLGNAFQEQGELKEAVKYYRKAVSIYPEYDKAHNNLGFTLKELGRLEEAIESYKNALATNPNEAVVHYNLGVALRELGRTDEALTSLMGAHDINPDSLNFAIGAYLFIPILISSMEDIAHYRERYQAGLRALEKKSGLFDCDSEQIDFNKYFLAYHNENNALLNEDLSRILRTNLDSLNMSSPHLETWQPPRENSKPIRIGFLSEFFRYHTIGKLYMGLIQHMDRRKFEVVVLHTPETKEDAFCHTLDSVADKSITLPIGIENQQLVVSAENLDILFYPDIGMVPSSYLLSHARLAPVQFVSWGHPDTTGVSTIDYFISAKNIEPDHAQSHYTERLIQLNRLPCYYPRPEVPTFLLNREDLGLPKTGNLYGCPQTLYKFHPDFDEILSDIAIGDPDGWIILIEGRVPAWADQLRERWRRNAPAILDRVLFLPAMPLDRFMSLLHNMDVLLDPVHFGSGNTLYEAMAFGIPIVTCPGQFMRSRIVSGAYSQMGIKDAPIARHYKDYAPLALKLGRDPARRHKLRQVLLEAASQELFSDTQAVREFEAFLKSAVEAAGQGTLLSSDWQPNTSHSMIGV